MAEPSSKPPPLCPHGYPMEPHPEDAKHMACTECEDALDALVEELRWGDE